MMRRIRVHQAWYRYTVLGIRDFGYLAGSGAPCGSVLPERDAARHLNFHGPAAIHRYLDRRSRGWGVDPIRCTMYLTSSQTLSFNMLADVVSRPRECAEAFNALLGRSDLEDLETSDFEFAAQGSGFALGDKTLLDIMLRFRTKRGGIRIVALETKLADRFSTRRTAGMAGDAYRRLAARSRLWRDLDTALSDGRSRQLARCHALAESIQIQEGRTGEHSILLALTHPDDASADRNLAAYAAMVAPGRSVIHRTWADFLDIVESTGAMKNDTAAELMRRYVDVSWSDEVWSEIRTSAAAVERLGANPHGPQ